MKVNESLSFFIPHTTSANQDSTYDLMKTAIKYQMGWDVTERRIQSLSYINNRKSLTARVGEFGQVEHQYEVVGIFEAALYIIVTKSKTGASGPTILVDGKDVTEVIDFKFKPRKATEPSPLI